MGVEGRSGRAGWQRKRMRGGGSDRRAGEGEIFFPHEVEKVPTNQEVTSALWSIG